VIQVELDRLGVEGGAIVENHVIPQVESVGQPIVRDLPRLGQARVS
jgi:hypothetical protein